MKMKVELLFLFSNQAKSSKLKNLNQSKNPNFISLTDFPEHQYHWTEMKWFDINSLSLNGELKLWEWAASHMKCTQSFDKWKRLREDFESFLDNCFYFFVHFFLMPGIASVLPLDTIAMSLLLDIVTLHLLTVWALVTLLMVKLN